MIALHFTSNKMTKRQKTISIIFTGLLIIIIALIANNKKTVNFRTIDNSSWRTKVRYKAVVKLTFETRQSIYREAVIQFSKCASPDSAYQLAAKKFNIEVTDIKNIIGEGIANDWKIDIDSK
jgi:hypothetical protein